jgi:pSer/pThr/pTyr-binding forkhead associated (FHA) protein
MLGKLIPCGGGAPVPLSKATVVIGRSRDCEIPIACGTVSTRHCELELRDGEWWVRDLGSKNGTAVNGIKREQQSVPPNAVLAMGRQRFILAYQPAAQPRPAGADEDIEALALQLLTGDDEPPPPPAALPSPRVHGPQAAPSPPHTRVKLGDLVPCGGGATIPLLRPELTVGRSSDSDICLRFPSISSRHCKLSLQDGYWFVEDLHSSNGTWVNGARCQKKCLMPESVLGLAKHRYTMRYTPKGAGPPPEEDVADVFSQSLLQKAGLAKLEKGGKLPGAQHDDEEEQTRRHKLDLDDI